MPSNAQDNLAVRLRDVAEVIAAHEALTGGGKGKPAGGKGGALTRAGIVLLSAAAEAFIEDLFEEAAALIYSSMTHSDMDFLIKNSSKRFNNPDCFKIEVLYLSLGMTRCLDGISWQNFTNTKLRIEFNNLVENRNGIAHGRGRFNRLQALKRWKTMVEAFAPRFEEKVSQRIIAVTGQRPAW